MRRLQEELQEEEIIISIIESTMVVILRLQAIYFFYLRILRRMSTFLINTNDLKETPKNKRINSVLMWIINIIHINFNKFFSKNIENINYNSHCKNIIFKIIQARTNPTNI